MRNVRLHEVHRIGRMEEHAIELLSHQQRLIDRYAAENSELRAELKQWQMRTLALIDRLLLPKAVSPEERVDNEKEEEEDTPRRPRLRQLCNTCGNKFRGGPNAHFCKTCRRLKRQETIKIAQSARAEKLAESIVSLEETSSFRISFPVVPEQSTCIMRFVETTHVGGRQLNMRIRRRKFLRSTLVIRSTRPRHLERQNASATN